MKYYTHCKICGVKLELDENSYTGICFDCENRRKKNSKVPFKDIKLSIENSPNKKD